MIKREYRKNGINHYFIRKHWREIIRLMSSDPAIPAVFFKWDNDDVRHVGVEMNIPDAKEWTDEQCANVLDHVQKYHNPAEGVNYDVIEFWIRELIL